MTDAAKKILAEFDALPEDDQRWLADVIVDRVRSTEQDEIHDAWAQVAVDRLKRAERGEAKLVSYGEVQAHVRATLRDE